MTNFARTARISAVLFGACALIAGSAVPASAAADPKEKTQASSEKPTAAGAVRVCVQQEAPTGSRIPPRRECKTRDQWIKDTGVDPLANR